MIVGSTTGRKTDSTLPIVFRVPFATAHRLRQVAAHHQCVQFLAAGLPIVSFAASGDGKAGAFIETSCRLIIFLDFEKHGAYAAPGIARRQACLDHDDFGSTRAKIMNVIDFPILERDAGGKPLHTFPHPAPARIPQKWIPVLRSEYAQVID